MIDFHRPQQGERKVVAAATFIALANVYTASGQPEKAQKQIGLALAEIKNNIENSPARSYGDPHQGYERILKRLPKSAETEHLLAEVEAKWKLRRDAEI